MRCEGCGSEEFNGVVCARCGLPATQGTDPVPPAGGESPAWPQNGGTTPPPVPSGEQPPWGAPPGPPPAAPPPAQPPTGGDQAGQEFYGQPSYGQQPSFGGGQPAFAGAGAGATPKKGLSTGAKIAIGAVVLVILGVVGVVALGFFALGDLDLDDAGNGSPERLAELRQGCQAGDMQACDDLYWESPFGSADEEFGDTCGGRNEPSGFCVDIYGPTAPPG